jgi:general stress protein 26
MADQDDEVQVHSGDDAGTRLQELLSGVRMVMVTTADGSGALASRPLTVQRVDGDGTLWFLVDAHARWVTETVDPVNVAASESDTWLSISGTAELLRSEAVLDDLGDPVSDTWFQEGAEKAALRVEVDRADYWSAPNRLAQLLEIGKGIVTRTQPDLGERGRLERPS